MMPRIEVTKEDDGVIGITIENCDNDDATVMLMVLLSELERNGYEQNLELATKTMEDYNESRKNRT